ncbi:hypothetical protein OHS71_02650 [Streptomyces sp. NBC_00377]|uniref:DUF3592 domain-containing protein n=1 Tax=unclassified Streptomyces TaxID=2593676 RepID=UPI002E1E250C|nr:MULTISPECIES: DUF3592 domain-containing protein [unclassified Streptomyces]
MSRYVPLMELWALLVALSTGVAVIVRLHAGYTRPYLEVTTGVVTEHTFVYGDEHNEGGYVPTLEFTIATGRLVRAKAKGKPLSEPVEQGTEVSVLYRRDRPDSWCRLGTLADYEQEADPGIWQTCLGVALVSGLFLGLVALMGLLPG